MTQILSLSSTRYGYILYGGGVKYLMNQSNINSLQTPYYLKQVEPISEYITGLFYKRRHNEYLGKTKDGQKVKLRLGINTAVLDII